MENMNEEQGNEMINKPFQFTGKGGEFFAIWIVNVALTILTLGIYSAWAKVRTHQYFYGNTILDGASFRYTANPIQILKGRVIAFIVFMLYYASSTMSPFIAGGALIVLMLLVPAFMVMSMAFRLRNSVYRNVRFNFDKNFKQAYIVFAIPVLITGIYIFAAGQLQGALIEDPESKFFSIATLVMFILMVLMFPWWEYMITHFKIVHAKYGMSDFKFSASTKNYYVMYLKMYGLMILLFGVGGGLVAAAMSNPALTNIAGIVMPFFIFVILVIYLWVFAYIQAKRTNLVYNNLDISGNKVQSELKVGYLLYLYVTNTLAMMVTFGLLMPWAKVRTARYRASVTSLNVIGDLGQFTSAQEQQQSAIGEEIGEMFDMDLGF